MFTSNPFAELSASVSPAMMQAYVVLMALLVVGGTLFDIIHKRSARYFFDNWRASKRQSHEASRRRRDDVHRDPDRLRSMSLASGEFCNARRRIAHLLGMYGFVIYVVDHRDHGLRLSDASDADARLLCRSCGTSAALMVCLGGYWFWFFIRVDVAAEGHSPFRFVRADLFIVSLVVSTTFGLIWAWLQAGATRLRRAFWL